MFWLQDCRQLPKTLELPATASARVCDTASAALDGELTVWLLRLGRAGFSAAVLARARVCPTPQEAGWQECAPHPSRPQPGC